MDNKDIIVNGETIIEQGEMIRKAISAKIKTNSGTIDILSMTSGLPVSTIEQFVKTGEIDEISLMTLNAMA